MARGGRFALWDSGFGIWILLPPLLLTGAACGKKGPPLAPFVRIPAAVDTIAARRVGGDVYVTLTIPALNVDGSTPPAVRRVELYAVTGTAPPPRGRFLEGAAMVASIDVSGAPLPDDRPRTDAQGLVPGSAATVTDALGDSDLVAATGTPAPDAQPVTLRRFYMAIAFSERGVPGPPGTVTEVSAAPLPDPPSAVEVSYTSDALTVSWQPPDGLIAFLIDRALPRESPPAGIEAPAVPAPPPAPAQSGPILYNVYREIAPDPLAFPMPPSAPLPAAPVPLNRAPVAALAFTEPVVLDERQRCYTVRTVHGTPPAAVESAASQPRCVTPFDVFPPAMPERLASVISVKAISLIWEPNDEADLAGYVVLRGEAGGDTLAALTPAPIREAQFTDDTVVAGVRYVYHVVAVDARLPLPNSSAAAIIEATAR